MKEFLKGLIVGILIWIIGLCIIFGIFGCKSKSKYPSTPNRVKYYYENNKKIKL